MTGTGGEGAIRAVERLADGLLIGLLLLIFALVLAQVVCRYGFNAPLIWSEELARVCFIWMVMLAWSLGSRRRTHLSITFVSNLLSPRPRAALKIAIQVLVIAFAVFLIVHGWKLTVSNLDLSLVTLDISYAFVYAVVPLGAAAVILYALAEIVRLVAALRTGGLEADAPEAGFLS